MRLKSFGCSFIFGTDLADAKFDWPDQTYSKSTWPALLAQKLGHDYSCYAHGGSGNLCILNRLLNSLSNDKPCFFVINWTYIDRFDYRDISDNGNDWSQIRPGDDSDFSRMYFKFLHSEYQDKITSLIAINTAIDVLVSQGRKFLMTSMDDLLLDQEYHIEPGIKLLQNKIRPYITTFEGKNFLDWSRSRGFAISKDNHPLEDAHRAAADYLLGLL